MLATFGLGLAIVISPCAYFLFPVVLITLFSGGNVASSKHASKSTERYVSSKEKSKQAKYKLLQSLYQKLRLLRVQGGLQNSAVYRTVLFFTGFLIGGLFLVSLSSILSKFLIFKSIKLALGMLFVALGVYSYFYNINGVSFNLPKFGVLGLGFAIPIVSSVSGCGLPFLTSALTLMSGFASIPKVVGFLAGLMLPYIIVVLAGELSVKFIKKFNEKYHRVLHYATPLLFIATGVYTVFSVFYINKVDLSQLLVIVILVFAVVCYLTCKGKYFTKKGVLFALVFSAFLAYLLWHFILLTCKTFSLNNAFGPLESLHFLKPYVGTTSEHVCNTKISYCPYCLTCNFIFIIASGLTAYVYITIKKLLEKNKIT